MAGRLKRLWGALRRPPARLSLGAVLIIGAVGAWVLLGGFVFAMEETSTNGFCQSCHEMDIAFAEYERSVHFRNATGVTATCSDCHIPQHSWPAKIVRKTQAGWNDVVGKIAGTISTPEKYEAHRGELAQKVWTSMKANDSRECRWCHDRAAMLPDEQSKMAQRNHKKALEQGMTCIECHQGVAHDLPQAPQRASSTTQQEPSTQ
jgi:nitrate/TMAO reductase-like tetraheme cytochrome c subunit